MIVYQLLLVDMYLQGHTSYESTVFYHKYTSNNVNIVMLL